MSIFKPISVLLLTFCFIHLYGCASIKESARGFAGISTKILEDNRNNGLKKTFNYDYDACYNKIMHALSINKCYVYAQDYKKNLIAVYVSEDDTTPAGIFLNKADGGNTLVEVSSPSTYAKEEISKVVFSAFDKEPVVLVETKGKLDVKKMLGH